MTFINFVNNYQITQVPVKTIHTKWSNELLDHLYNAVNTADIYSKLNYDLDFNPNDKL